VINGDILLEVKCPFPIPTKWTCLDEPIRAGKYDVVESNFKNSAENKAFISYFIYNPMHHFLRIKCS
jgi:hypothetical protein